MGNQAQNKTESLTSQCTMKNKIMNWNRCPTPDNSNAATSHDQIPKNKKIHRVCDTYELLLAPLSPAFAGGCDARPSNSTGSSPSAAAAPDSRLGASDGILEEEELPAATGADIALPVGLDSKQDLTGGPTIP